MHTLNIKVPDAERSLNKRVNTTNSPLTYTEYTYYF